MAIERVVSIVFISMFMLFVDRVLCQYSCSIRPTGQCKPCDCVPDCFDLSDEINCKNNTSIHDVLHSHHSAIDTVLRLGSDPKLGFQSKFIPPPPLPPFPLCADPTTTSTTNKPSTTTLPITTNKDNFTPEIKMYTSVKPSSGSDKYTTNTIPNTSVITMKPSTEMPQTTVTGAQIPYTTPTLHTSIKPPVRTTVSTAQTVSKHMEWTTRPTTRDATLIGLTSTIKTRGPPSTKGTQSSPCRRNTDNDEFCRRRYRGYYRHPFNCEKYVVCEWGEYHECQCPPLTRWDMGIVACIWSPCLSREPSTIINRQITPSKIANLIGLYGTTNVANQATFNYRYR